MAKKNKNNRRDGIVYSTDPDFAYEDEAMEAEETLVPAEQDLRVWRDRLKGNKMATRVEGFVGDADALKDLAKELKQHCACGGNAKDGKIILQGDVRDKVVSWLQGAGYKAKAAGG